MSDTPWRSFYDPMDDLVESLAETSKHTHDVPIISQYLNHYVFVYGTLKQSERRGDLLKLTRDAQLCGTAVTEKKVYDMVLAPVDNFSDAFPVLLEGTSQQRQTAVRGELWLVPTQTLIRLDRIEANGSMFERQEIPVHCGKNKVMAWCYLGCNDFWKMYPHADDMSPIFKDGKKYYEYKEVIL